MSSIGWFPVFIQVSISISVRDIISQVKETFTFEVFVLGGSSVAMPLALFTRERSLFRYFYPKLSLELLCIRGCNFATNVSVIHLAQNLA